MTDEREPISKTELAAAPDSGMPVFSFSATDDNAGLAPEYFEIEGNKFAGFYDGAHRLIFVLDETHTENTPNALLVIGAQGGRKWDDILGNDYKLDLEEIRPKKNNKYQKLDIDYEGLGIYGQLIADYRTGGDTGASLQALGDFRALVGKKLAEARLLAATREIEIASATMEKAVAAIAKLRAQLKSLKTKLAEAKAGIGKKPTKESAAKILKIQSQADKADEKEKRAEQRMRRAKKRQEDAMRDAETARKILNAAAPVREERVVQPVGAHKETKHKEPEMADKNNHEEPKPLFDRDPEIIDDKIAFQPIGFETTGSFDAGAAQPAAADTVFPTPQPAEEPAYAEAPADRPITVAPVMNTATPINMTTPAFSETPTTQPAGAYSPTMQMAPPFAEASGGRPVHPGGGGMMPLSPGTHGANNKKPTAIYYIMLILLIGLSILTLWLYQTRMDNAAAPELASASNQPELITAPKISKTAPRPQATDRYIYVPAPGGTAAKTEPAPQPQPFLEQPASKPEYRIVSQPYFEAEEEEAVTVNKPEYSLLGPSRYEPEAAPEPVIEQQYFAEESEYMRTSQAEGGRSSNNYEDTRSEASESDVYEIAAGGSLSGNLSEMAAEEDFYEAPYEAPMAAPEPEVFYNPSTDNSTYADFSDESPFAEAMGDRLPAQEAMEEPQQQYCSSGTEPDEDGCCPGENLQWVESFNGYGCCSAEDGECYPPMR
ncbi:MAG: hypothetical protein FWF97_02540 [Alphaproteobacteria bacterium]|nr:hypothetical protein [Alphaproteobacteria bacterium]